MWIDKRSEFADAVEITLGAGTNALGDTVDLGTARDIGAGKSLYLIIQVTTALAGGTACQFILASDAQDPITADGNETRHFTSDLFLDAELTAGFTMSVPLPSGDTKQGEDTAGYERFLGIVTIATGTHTAGSINAFLSPDSYGNVRYPDGNK